jgi:hypothetical protein
MSDRCNADIAQVVAGQARQHVEIDGVFLERGRILSKTEISEPVSYGHDRGYQYHRLRRRQSYHDRRAWLVMEMSTRWVTAMSADWFRMGDHRAGA